MIPLSTTAIAAQIRLLIDTVTDSNSDSIFRDLCQLADSEPEGCVLLLNACFEQVKPSESQLKRDLLSRVFKYLLEKPSFSSNFCEALKTVTITEKFLEDLSNQLNLSLPEKIGASLALFDSENLELRLRGLNFCIAEIEGFCENPSDALSNEKIQEVALFILQNDNLSKHIETFTKIISILESKESIFLIPSLDLKNNPYPEGPLRTWEQLVSKSNTGIEKYLSEIERETNSTDILKEFGYSCMASSEHFKFALSLLSPLNDAIISKLIGTMVKSRTGLQDGTGAFSVVLSVLGSGLVCESASLTTWDVAVFVDSVNQMVPNTNWKSVIENLDHEGFFVPDEPAFNFLMSIYTHACQDPFPLEAVFGRIWKNTEGQLSLLKYAVASAPDIFSFAHSAHLMGFAEVAHLKQGNEAWFSLDLLEVLCQLAELGHSNSVKKIIEFPITHFADVLLLGVSHIKTAYNLIQNEVLSRTFSIILRDTSKLNVISCLWRVNPMMLIRGFIETYIDLNCLTRINTVCNDLKILSVVLDTVPFCFSIRLACVASNKDQFNLEKWLTENLAVYKDIFSEECVKFLKESLSSSESSDNNPDSAQNTVMNIYKESGSTFLKVLQAHSGQNISEQLSDEINKQLNSLYISSNISSNSNTSSQAGTEQEAVSEDIEKEANKYFHQMFSGQITTDQMIQMLTRFRDSPPDKRENMIFNCMIANLFEEYKFFPKYPDKQLKLAAVLFGSLIKHHLVAHLSLGIALRGVLDALRKSVDSKMFVFGTKALEQFMDRLVEWPQYCNHILQISHLRGTHPDLVAAVERTLARVSSSQNNNEPTTVPASIETSIEGSEASWQMAGTVPSQLGRQVSSFQIQQQQQQQQRAAVPAAPQVFPITGPVPVTVQRLTNQSKPQISSVPQPTIATDPPAPTVPPKPVVTQSLLASSSSGSSTTGFSRPRNLATGALRQTSYSSTGFGSALNIETLVAAAERRDTAIETPPSEIQDKILFMINNISTSNMEAKAKDFIDVLPEQYFPWFAQYMVMKRASIEPNFHDLYLKFVDKVNSKALNKEVLKATYENCKVLLRSELIKSSSEERSLLKNLGSWLGKFTIGRNQSLRAKEIDPKALIIEAYERGLMIAVIPFTSKILEPCHSSIAYRPPNPWTMGILSLLVEIYNLPNLKMNLKFDIEVLFKNLSWDMKEVKPASLIKDRPREIEGNPDFSNKDLISTVPQPVPPIVVPEVTSSSMMSTASHVELPPDVSSITAASRPSLPNILNQYAGPIHFSASSMAEEEKLGALIMPEQVSISSSAHVSQPPPPPSPSQFSLAQLMQAIPRADTYFRINPKLTAMVGPQIPLNRIIEAAMEKSVKEIVSPVIQRSVTIASRTTKEIILKDYALEPDDNIISRAAHLMVGTLSGSLAHVTCKEPLRVALTNHLRTLLQNVENNEQIIQILITDHLDLGCALIESVATRKSVDVIDAEIGQALAQIRKQREAAGSNYYDAYTYAQGPFARVPEALRPKPGQLSHSQIRVYEDFVNVWQTPPPSQNPSPGLTSQGAGASVAGASASSVAPQLLDLPTDDFDRITAQIPSMSANEAPVARVATPEIIPASTESVPVTKQDLVVVVPPSPAPVSDRLGTTTPEPLSTGDALERYMHVSQKLEALIAKEARDTEIQAVVAEVPDIICRCITRDEAALAMAQKVFRSLYENASNGVHVASYLAVLVAIRDVCKLAVKELTSWVIYSDEEKKFNIDITIGLIRSELLNLGEYNLHLAKLIDAGRNKAATEFAISLVQTFVTQESGVFISELFNVVDVLSKIANRPGSPESLQQLIEIVKNNNNGSLKEEKARQSRDKKVVTRVKEEASSSDASLPDPPGFQDQVAVLFTEWCQICDLPVVNDIAYNHFISQLQQNGLLKGDDVTERFFRVLTELAVAHSLVNEQASPSSISSQTHMNNNPPIYYFPIDSYCKLSVVILKYASVDQIPNKAILLVKLLSVTAKVLQKEAEEKKTSFNPRPYYRLFINWFIDIVSPDSDGANFPVLTCFANAFHALQPLRVPGFSYAWLELISHRNFMPKILTVNSSKGWPFFQRLVVDLFKFLDPFLRSKDIPKPVVFFYKGVLKMLLVLLHDFPEFLCDYHFSFCDVIPTTCIQLRNLILSAFPRNMRLPDPSTPNLKIDLLPEILQPPRILSDVESALKAKQLKADIDEYLKTRNENSPFLTDLKHKLLLPQNEVTQTGTKYNVPLINSLVLYIGMQAIQQLQSKSGAGGPPQQMSHSPMDIFLVGAAMDVYQSLVKNLDTEGRYYLVNAICNQLRYPNNHTHYFSFVLLYLWAEATTDLIQEQITRVLLERLIVNRPHPWGLLITFIEMIKNPRYSFWNRNFTRAAPDIEKLFESVSRSCGAGPISKALEEGLASSVSDVNH